MRPANYRVMPAATNTLLYVIQDIGPWDQYATVTNRAEEVHAELLNVMDGRKLACLDSEGMLDLITIGRDGRALFHRCCDHWTGPHGARVDAYALTWRRIWGHRQRGSLRAEEDLPKLEEQWAALTDEEQDMLIDLGFSLQFD
jgi:hypothetical protein